MVRGSRSRSSRSAYSGPSSSRSSSRAAVAKLRTLRAPPGLPGELGQLVGAEDEHRDERDAPPARAGRPRTRVRTYWSGVSPSCMPARPRPRPASRVGDLDAARGRRARSGRTRRSACRRRRPRAARVERDLAEHGDVVAEPLRERRRDPGAAAGAEDLEPVLGPSRAVRAGQVAHVLDDADDPLVHHRGHRAGALGDLGGGLLRRGDHDDLGARQVLAERDRHVAGAGRQVEQQHVEVAPVDVGEHLHQRPVEHRAAPGDHLVAARLEHADRDHRDAATPSAPA